MREQFVKKFNSFREGSAKVMLAISNQRYIVVLKNAMPGYVPFTIMGAIVLLIANFPSQHYLDFMAGVFGANWQAPLNDLMNGAMNIGSLYVIALIAYEMSNYHKDRPILPVILSEGIYIYLSQITTVKGVAMIAISEFGASNMIAAILLGIIVPELYHFLIGHVPTIKMPESVPPMIAQPFEALIPILLIFVLAFGVRTLSAMTPFGTFAAAINGTIGLPMRALSSNIWGYLLAVFFVELLWSLGIHGNNVVMSILTPFLLMNSDANRLAFQAGKKLPYIITNEYFDYFGNVAFYMCIACLLIAKAPQLKQVSRLGFIPGLFHISEPLVFGLPIMYNPFLATEYVLFHVAGAGLTYFVMHIGLVAPLNGTGVPWTTPMILHGFLASGGHISTGIWQLVLAVLYTVGSIPFVRAYDRKLMSDNAKSEREINESANDPV
ncbi:MAG: PTS transporter subunit EIIC [Lactobacillus sp.]|jgi:PTS system cellobiose-specific IIC component|uniref:Permease IIC component n=1 Tax=Lacticaseibacillus suilingensis TaxID=2799577 RepID=A0ABW4BJH3_9LACO|nr:PTS transporter subunit EIIC [Lacticaseibacillus suilingensis]MCI1895062.1 PTS transporter subunit EIIC [Lactobacillus sp.]MCI1918376.1 PTS transporter subunit EIIC [Lactobacillus sp.]MCI1942113.1 PTS transporter subunit EIIC [Lactobacillus sp.]MCI1972496.1 PTS transporter subunit EIIC [Lactobacillus sp.]MCI2017212.1 PTS transporter subunit EIIC [Lactobacillus sp.]